MYRFKLYHDVFQPVAEAVLNTQHNITYVFSGEAEVNGELLGADMADYCRDALRIKAGSDGARIWRWELDRTEMPDKLAIGNGVSSMLKMCRKIKMFEMYPTTRWQFKLDAILNNTGSTGLHTHPGAGIRCMLAGNLTTVSEKGGDSVNTKTGDAWYEEGVYPVNSTTDEGTTSNFMRCMILPPEFAIYPGEAPTWIEGKKGAESDWKGYISEIITLR